MCPPSTHALLARFIEALPKSDSECESILVIAGDVVDFLAEAPYQAFTVDENEACAKLEHIFDSSKSVWDALNGFARNKHGTLNIMLGNHDIELALPRVRQMFIERVGVGRTSLFYDNEACVIGPVLIEHGNRFDAWNAVPHGALRRVRSQLSRRLPVEPGFPELPGSRMVTEVINPLKRQYPFIDLLKPEQAVALPIAAALGAIGLTTTWQAFKKFRDTWAVEYDEASGEPTNPDYIAGELDPDQEVWDLAQDIAARADIRTDEDGSGGFPDLRAIARSGINAVNTALHAARLSALFQAFRELGKLRRLHEETFAVDREIEGYLVPARRSFEAGFEAVVYGHTHLPKHVKGEREQGGETHYINTGTWADLMCMPEGVWDQDEVQGREAFNRFCQDLGAANLANWRRSMPTYALIEIADGHVCEAGLHFADDGTLVTTDGVQRRLAAVTGNG